MAMTEMNYPLSGGSADTAYLTHTVTSNTETVQLPFAPKGVAIICEALSGQYCKYLWNDAGVVISIAPNNTVYTQYISVSGDVLTFVPVTGDMTGKTADIWIYK